MIAVRCLGHIATAVGATEVSLDGTDLDASEIVERLRVMSGKNEPGFTKYNTLLMLEDGEAYVSAGSLRKIRHGERVALIPFSHGG